MVRDFTDEALAPFDHPSAEGAVFDHALAGGEVEALAADDGDLRAGVAEHIVVDLRRDVRLESPHGLLVGAGGFVAAVEVVGA